MQSSFPSVRGAGLVAALSLIVGCEMSSFSEAGPGEGEGEPTLECVGANDCPLGSYCSEFGRCVESELLPGGDGGPGTAPLPPENEQESRRPASGRRYVYVAMTDLDTVARIDSETLDITTLPVGDRPGEIATAPGQDLAVVINHGSDSVTVLRTDDDGADQLTTLPTLPHLNRVEIDPLGRHAIAYFELLSADASEVGSFQDVVVIRLARGEERAFNVSVGFRPRRIVFHPDGSHAYIYTDDGVSIVSLADDETDFVAPLRPLSGAPFGDDPLDDNQPLEVVIARDGSRAFARFAEQSFVRAVSLDDGSHTDLPLAAPPSDIDLSDDASKLVAVVRDTASLVVLPLPAVLDDASAAITIDCAPLSVGLVELTASGERALVFTNAESEEALGLVDLAAASLTIVPLRKAVSTVVLTPDDEKALVIHNKVPGEPSPTQDFDTQLTHRHGFSIVELGSQFAKLQLTEARPGPVSLAADSSAIHLIVADAARGLRDVVAVDLVSLVATSIPMSSHPTEIGGVPSSGQVFVSQRHEMGRMSFIDSAGEVRTVTGFQLNSQITE